MSSEFLTESPPTPATVHAGDDVKIRYFGHACLLIETNGASILREPVISYKYDTCLPRYAYEDLPAAIDYCSLTHDRCGHCIFEALLQLRRKIKEIIVPRGSASELVDPSLKLIL